MLNIACVSPDGKPAAVEYNTKQIINSIKRFSDADIILFPRLCISSASCGHMYRQPTLINAVKSGAYNSRAGKKPICNSRHAYKARLR